MPRPTRWSQLVPGLATLGVLAGILIAILVFARVGSLHGRTIRLFVATDNATGVIKGTEVWFAGERIGLVDRTSLRPVSVDTSQRVLVELHVLSRAMRRLRRDSRAQIRPGSSMVGQPVVYFSGGSVGSREVNANDTIVASPQGALDETRAQFTDAAALVPALHAGVESLSTQLFSKSGTIGAASSDGPRLRSLSIELAHRTKLRSSGLDSLTKAARDQFESHITHLMTTTDSLQRIVVSPSSTLGRFQRDSTLIRAVLGVRAELDSTERLLTTPEGTLGRFATDSAIRRRLAIVDSSLAALSRDAAAQPLRYLPF
jgi:MlaD protein